MSRIMKVTVIKSIDNVQPYIFHEGDGQFECIDAEAKGQFTGIECTMINSDGKDEQILLILPRGDKPCENTFLLADAIREE